MKALALSTVACWVLACASAELGEEGSQSGNGFCDLPNVKAPVAPVESSSVEDCQQFAALADVALAAERPLGWASTDDLGMDGTSGGDGGEVVLVTDTAGLRLVSDSVEPMVILFCGRLGDGVERVNIGSNKTVLGVGRRPTLAGALEIKDVANVVVRNLYVQGAACADSPTDCSGGADAVTVRGSHHVWLDHLDVRDGSDGNLDVTSASDYVTVSWSRFSYTDTSREHRFSNLIGSSDDDLEDAEHLKVTWHHNWWSDGVQERMPRARFGDVHIFNNYYRSDASKKCIEAGFQSRVLVEQNFFHAVTRPMLYSSGGQVEDADNAFRLTSGAISSSGASFNPPYDYELDPLCDVPEIVVKGAGPQLEVEP